MLSPKEIRLILLGPPILTVVILAGCFNKNPEQKLNNKENLLLTLYEGEGMEEKKLNKNEKCECCEKCEKCGEVRHNCKCEGCDCSKYKCTCEKCKC